MISYTVLTNAEMSETHPKKNQYRNFKIMIRIFNLFLTKRNGNSRNTFFYQHFLFLR